MEALEKLTGPPIAPKITASACFAAVSASSVNGEPVASIEACKVLRLCQSLRTTSCLNAKRMKEWVATHTAQQVFLNIKLDLRLMFCYHPKNLQFVKPEICATSGSKKEGTLRASVVTSIVSTEYIS